MEDSLIKVTRRDGVVLIYRVPRWPSGAPVAWQAEDKAKAVLTSPFGTFIRGPYGAPGE
jgi:hypothetical protein